MKKFMISLMFLFFLTACESKIEISQLGVVAGFGLDKEGDEYLLTAQIVNPESVAGTKTSHAPVYTIESKGKTFYEAYRGLYTKTSSVLHFPHLSVIVLSDEIAREGIDPIIDFVLRNPEIRPDLNLVITKDFEANDIVQILNAGTSVPIQTLSGSASGCKTCEVVRVNFNLFDVANRINNKEANLVLNVASIVGTVEEGSGVKNYEQTKPHAQLEINQLAVFNNDKLVGYLNEEESEIYNLLNNDTRNVVISNVLDENTMLSTEVKTSKIQFKPDLEKKLITVEGEIETRIVDMTYPIDLGNKENLKIVEKMIEDELKTRVMGLLYKGKNDLKTDMFSIGNLIHLKSRHKWDDIEARYDEIFPQLDYDVKIKVKVVEVGDIINLQ